MALRLLKCSLVLVRFPALLPMQFSRFDSDCRSAPMGLDSVASLPVQGYHYFPPDYVGFSTGQVFDLVGFSLAHW